MPPTLRIACCVALLPAAIAAQAPRDPAMVARVVDSLAQRIVADDIVPGLGVAIAMDGRVVHARSIGSADVTARRPADDRTLWYLASTSKSFLGFALSLMEVHGTLRLDDRISTLLPDVAWHPSVRGDTITLAQLLSHTHRVNDNAVVMSAAFTGAIAEKRWPSLIRLAERMDNDDLVYANFGYNVGAMVIDAKRTEGWKRVLQRDVLRPAGMHDTYARVSGLSKRIAMPHRIGRDGRYATESFQKVDATMNAAGGHLATVGDLARWTIVQMDSGMINGRRVFPAAAIERSHRLLARHTRPQSRRFAYFDREGWAAGWDIGSYEGHRMVSRFGSYHSTRSHLSFLPGRRIGVVAMASAGPSIVTDIIAAFAYDLDAGHPDARGRAAQRVDELRRARANAVRGVAAQDSTRAARQRVPLAHPIAAFAGTYREPAYGAITFRVQRGRLEYRWGALHGPVEVFDATKNQMRLEIAGSGDVVTFGFDGASRAKWIELRGIRFTR